MLQRILQSKIKQMAKKMPVLSISGPRQSGKTTISKICFPDHKYVNLENPDVLEEAISDPRHFLSSHKKGIIIDEAQRAPKLFSYIQTISDENKKSGEFILTGSQNFLLSENISQSLAGRVYISNLLPFSLTEIKDSAFWKESYQHFIFNGFYPRIYDKKINAVDFYPSYIQSYIERDVRQVLNFSNILNFQKFMRLAAGRIGQLLNYSELANEVGVDMKTIKSWFGILESSFITFLLPPHHRNFNKRLVKSPKLYFYDTGLACSLLGIHSEKDIDNHWAKGALFENFVLLEIAKSYYNKGQRPPIYFWRDNTGNEIDCLIDEGNNITTIEIKSGTTLSNDQFKNLENYSRLNDPIKTKQLLIYGGKNNGKRNNTEVVSWTTLSMKHSLF